MVARNKNQPFAYIFVSIVEEGVHVVTDGFVLNMSIYMPLIRA